MTLREAIGLLSGAGVSLYFMLSWMATWTYSGPDIPWRWWHPAIAIFIAGLATMVLSIGQFSRPEFTKDELDLIKRFRRDNP